jgi:hypothetical protein
MGDDAKSMPTLGFLTVVEHPQHGLFGGYLLLTMNGRPLEFHCTAPVKPNRAQEILFGPTLAPYLYGEQIGRTLLSKSSVEPLIVCTDLPAVLAVREHTTVPVALVIASESAPAAPDLASGGGKSVRVDAAHVSVPHAAFMFRTRSLAVSAAHRGDQSLVLERLAATADHLDLAEPFERIRGAIEEAQRGGK